MDFRYRYGFGSLREMMAQREQVRFHASAQAAEEE